MAYTFFENYHQTIKEFSQGSLETYGRLMMIINTYAIEGEVLEDMTAVEKLFFNTIKPSLDKSIRMRELGKKGGSVTKAEKNTALTSVNEKACKPFEKACNEVEVEVEVEKEYEVEEEVEVEVEVNDSTLLTTQNIIKNFAFTHGFTFGNKTVKELSESLKFESDAWDSLNKQLAFVKSKYPNKRGDELAKLFVASLHWDRKKEIEPAPELPKEKEKNPPPKKCPICNSKLIRSGMDQVLCGHCREKGKLVWWEKENGIWTRQDSETA